MPAQQKNSTLRPFHSTRRRCCLRSLGIYSCAVVDPCKRPGAAYLDSAKWNLDLPACSGTLPSGERKGSGPCNQSPDYEYAREGVRQTSNHMPCRLLSLTQYEREAQLGSERDGRDRRIAPQTHWRTRFVRLAP